MKKPEFDVFTASSKIAVALDNRNWDEVEEVFRSLLEHKRSLQAYKSQAAKRRPKVI